MRCVKLVLVAVLALALPSMALDKSSCKKLEKDVKATY